MAKSRKRAKQKQAQQQSLMALKRNGQKAFDRQAYADASEIWQRAAKKGSDDALSAALAEANFRLAMAADLSKGAGDARIAALEAALTHTPNDARLHYHLGMMQLRIGKNREARAQLAIAANDAAFAQRAAFPLTVAQIQLGEALTQREQLSADQHALVTQLAQFQRRPYSADSPATLRGFVAYDEGDWESAEKELSAALPNATPDERAILHKYLGNIAAQREVWEDALNHWQQADQLGLQDATLSENLGELYQRLAEEALQKGDSKRAGQLAHEAYRFKANDNQLNQLVAHLQMREGNAAAQAQQWHEAIRHWEATQKTSGSSFRLAYNLAIAYEKLDAHELAAETWREVLRRRPRSADHADALSDDQVAQIWRRSAEAYIKDEQYDEALSVYRTAIKYDSDNLPLRMAFAEAAFTEGRFQLAENELDRILKKDADYIPALLLIGDVRVESSHYWWGNPTRSWQRILEIDPNHQAARDSLADYHLGAVEDMQGWFYSPEQAHDHLEKALKYAPNRPDVLYEAGINKVQYENDLEGAAALFDLALQNSGRDLDMYGQILSLWLTLDEDERAEQVLALAKQRVPEIPASFYVMVATICYRTEREDIAPQWVDRALNAANTDEPILLILAQGLVFSGQGEVARGYLQQVIEQKEREAEAYYLLGMIAAQAHDMPTAKKEWRKAEKLARRQKDQALLEQIERVRMMYDSPFGGMFNQLMRGDMSGLPPGLLEMMMDEEDDDDDWF